MTYIQRIEINCYQELQESSLEVQLLLGRSEITSASLSTQGQLVLIIFNDSGYSNTKIYL